MPGKKLSRFLRNEKARAQVLSGVVIALMLTVAMMGFLVMLPKNTSAAWWDNSWQYYRVCNINASGYSGNYQMRINVSYSGGGDVSCGGHCQADFDDIRFVDMDNTTVLPYWKETYVSSSYAIFWVNVSADAMTDGKILMYYGNSGATDASDGDATFTFFDDFDGSSLDTTKWQTKIDGGSALNVTISSSIIQINKNDSYIGYVYSIANFSYPVAFHGKIKLDNSNAGTGGHGKNIGFDNAPYGETVLDEADFVWHSGVFRLVHW